MSVHKIVGEVEIFYTLASLEKEELPENSDNLDEVLKNLEEIKTFACRKKYAEKNLKHLSSGSSRLIYLTPDKNVIKLAKNDKGIAQNKTEANPKIKSKYINKTLKVAKNYSWIEVVYLDKITEKEFEKLTDINFKDFGEALSYSLKHVSGSTGKKKPDNYDEIKKSPIFKELTKLGEDFDLLPGDLSRISSWGMKDKTPVLIDSGLTSKIFDKFYESSESSKS